MCTGIADLPCALNTAYTLIMAAFGVTNGYLSTLCFVAGIQVPDLEANEVDLAGTCLALYLTLGLTAGALLCVFLSPDKSHKVFTLTSNVSL